MMRSNSNQRLNRPMPELHSCVSFHFLISDRLCVKMKKIKQKRNAAGRRSSAPRLRRTQRRVGSLLPTSCSLYSRRHCGSRNTRFNVGSETKYGEERSAASSVRVSAKRCSAVPAPTGNVGRRDQNGGSYFDGSQTHPQLGERPPLSAARGGII